MRSDNGKGDKHDQSKKFADNPKLLRLAKRRQAPSYLSLPDLHSVFADSDVPKTLSTCSEKTETTQAFRHGKCETPRCEQAAPKPDLQRAQTNARGPSKAVVTLLSC